MIKLKRFLELLLLTIIIVTIGACSTTSDIVNIPIVTEKQSNITISFIESKREHIEGAVRVSFEVLTPKDADIYRWSWGDGKERIERTPFASHDYEVSGNFPVILVVSTGGNDTAIFKQTVVITEEEAIRFGGHKSPVAILSISKISQEQADEIIDSQGLDVLARPMETLAESKQRHWFWFDACKSYDPDGEGVIRYKIDFGDRHHAQSKLCNVLYFYTDSKEYAVTLTVTDSRGAIGLTEQNLSW